MFIVTLCLRDCTDVEQATLTEEELNHCVDFEDFFEEFENNRGEVDWTEDADGTSNA